MPSEIVTPDAFKDAFLRAIDRYYGDVPLYTLILGAGASRSAGIPLASEMVSALKQLAKIRKFRVGRARRGESELSRYFRTVFKSLKPNGKVDDDDAKYAATGRKFLLNCLHRAEREANLTHVVAAHFARAGIANPIITTNFDDLLLSAFWSLPWTGGRYRHLSDEPHIIYDPLSRLIPEIGERVPIVVKAHGHHTTYGMGIVDDEIASWAPRIRRLAGDLPRPTVGYIVVGYSGGWDDGIVRLLSDPKLMLGKDIYWLFRGSEPPRSKYIDQISRHSRIKFVSIGDADLFFVKMAFWVPDNEFFSIGYRLQASNLFSFLPGWHRNYGASDNPYRWFTPNLTQSHGKPWEWEEPLRFQKIQQQILPILNSLERWDEKYLIEDCVRGGHDDTNEQKAKWDLQKLIPIDIEWTRRNRKLLKIALTSESDIQMSANLLGGLVTTH